MNQFETVEFVGYSKDSGHYPYMVLRLNGIETQIFKELRSFRDFVWVGERFNVQVEREGKIFRHCTDDPRVLAFYREFMSR